MSYHSLERVLKEEYSYIFCVDGGGSKTALHVLNERHENIFHITLKGSNLNTRFYDTIAQEMRGAIETRFFDRKPFREIVKDSLFIGGFAGAKSNKNKEALYGLVKSLGFLPHKISIMGDAELALEIVGEKGLILICGTGAVCYGKNITKKARAGGLGPNLGDEGSAYYIGKLGIESRLVSTNDTHPSTIASLAQQIFKMKEEGVFQAEKIIGKAEEALASLVKSVMDDLALEECYVYCLGGIFKNKEAQDFIKKIKGRCSHHPIFINLDGYDIACLAVREKICEQHLKNTGQKAMFPIPPLSFRKTYLSSVKTANVTTEQQHPLTQNLDKVFKSNIIEGLKVLHRVDMETFQVLREKHGKLIQKLYERCKKTLESGGRVFLCGAGSSGRVAYILAAKCREAGIFFGEQIIPLMAGGVRAFVRAVEGVEDLFEEGKADFVKFSPQKNDCVVLISASGSATYNFGVAACARERGLLPLLFCNTQVFAEHTEKAIEKYGIEVLPFDTGPQAITGSTRLQAANIGLLVLGSVFHVVFCGENSEGEFWEGYQTLLEALPLYFEEIKPLIEIYSKALDKHCITYLGGEKVLREIMVDSAEMPPTYSLHPPRKITESNRLQAEFRAYLHGKASNREAWEKLAGARLGEDEWKVCREILLGSCDLGFTSLDERKGEGSLIVKVDKTRKGYIFELYGENVLSMELRYEDTLGIIPSIILKQLLNYLSNATMILKGRVWGNIMVDLSPSNHKLVDRSVRIVKEIHEDKVGGAVPCGEFLREYIIRSHYRKKISPSTPSPVRQVLKALEEESKI